MISVKELQNLYDLNPAFSTNFEVCEIPLFHGTRRLALSASNNERESFYSACKTVMNFAKNYAYNNTLDEDKINIYRKEKNPYFLDTAVYLYNTNKYNYGNFYITSSYTCALSFSCYAGGELGEYAYSQYRGFCDFDIELDTTIKNAGEIIKKEYEKYCKSEKVILIYKNIKFTDLITEGGTPFIASNKDSEYIKYKINSLYKNPHANNNFSLLNLENYTALALPEKDFRTGFSLFTNIKDIDKAIKDHNFDSNPKWCF